MRASRRVFRRLRASSIIRAFREDAVIRIISFFGALALAIVSAAAFAQDKPEASNMRLVGYNDLQGRSAYQPWIHHQGDRWIAYIGHHGGVPAADDEEAQVFGQVEAQALGEPRGLRHRLGVVLEARRHRLRRREHVGEVPPP